MHFMKISPSAAVYALGHFLVDLSCALIMLSVGAEIWHFVMYNFLAFAVQMPIGLLADGIGNNRRFALIGVILVVLGFLPCPVIFRVAFVGLGNACYHIGGGRDALLQKGGLTGLGFFVSPGAIGILLGTLCSHIAWLHMVVAAALVICWILVISFCNDCAVFSKKGRFSVPQAAIMMSVVLLRSFVGMSMETPWKIGGFIILGALAAAGGKALGGVLADCFGWKITGTVSLIISGLLFLLPENGMIGIIGVFLFNMSMPITLGQAADSCSGYEGFAFGMLTFGLFLGYLPSVFGITVSSWIGAMLSLISAGLLAAAPEEIYD